jgi:Na+/H+-translocating membrane pyrophosphatase
MMRHIQFPLPKIVNNMTAAKPFVRIATDELDSVRYNNTTAITAPGVAINHGIILRFEFRTINRNSEPSPSHAISALAQNCYMKMQLLHVILNITITYYLKDE